MLITPIEPFLALSDAAKKLQEELSQTAQRGNFVLSGGDRSSVFFEVQRAVLTGRGFEAAGHLLAWLARAYKATAVGGPATGAISLVCAAISQNPELHGFYFSEPGVKFSGLLDFDDRALVIDDVVTTGASLRHAVESTEKRGVKVVAAVSVIDRSSKGLSFSVPYLPLFKSGYLKA